MATNLRSSFSAFLLICLFVTASSAQERTTDYTISLREKTFIPAPNAPAWLDSFYATKDRGELQQVMIQFYALPEEGQKQELRNAGIQLNDYISGNAYQALIQFKGKVANAGNIRSIVPVNPLWKIDKRLQPGSSSAPVTVVVSFVKTPGIHEAIEAVLLSVNATVVDKKFEALLAFEISLPHNKLLELAAHPLVKYIGKAANPFPLNDDVRGSTGADLLQSVFPGGLTGTGVTLCIGDNSAALYHVDTRDRTVNFNPWTAMQHGSHTSGTAAGAGILDPRARGMAPEARILSHLFDIGWAQTPFLFPFYNMTLTSNSYAAVVSDCDFAGTYDQYAALLDEYSIDYPEVLNVFAAGNDGIMTCGAYPQGFRTVAGGYQPAKNIITVGGLGKDRNVYLKSSRGPVRDGRLKPEIVNLGWSVYSCGTYDQYAVDGGTSMATPGVTGALALLTEQYKKTYNTNPHAALLKTLLLNSAVDMGNPGPDFRYGYGALDIFRASQLLSNEQFLTDSVSNGSNKLFSIIVPPNMAQLKIMLCWNDVPASPTAVNALVNNLDLEVLAPGGNLHHPLVLDPSPANVTNNAVEGLDNRNNSEQVVINNPQQGTYTIQAKGSAIPSGVQPFVIAYDFVPVGIQINSPAAGTPVAAGDSIQIYWSASDNLNSFTVEYSPDNGSSWNVISANVPADQRYLFWYVPDIATAQARLRISRNNTTQQTTTGAFSITPQPLLQLDTAQCPGYMSISWNAVPTISTYEVLRKMGNAMQPVAVVTGNHYVFSGLFPDSTYYAAVRPIINGVKGFRSVAVMRQPDDGSCAGSVSDGDLMIASVVSPSSGRKFTSTEPGSNETLTIMLRNLDDVPVSNYKLSYNINGGGWQSQIFNDPIAANTAAPVSMQGLDLSGSGNYVIRIAVENLQSNDPVKSNDSITKTLRHLENNPVDLNNGFLDDFEANDFITVLHDSLGVLAGDHWDFSNTSDSGRLRTYVSDDVLIGGEKSLSLDLLLNLPDNRNYVTGTFNLSNYQAASTEARMELLYKFHGTPKFLEGNEIWVRGSDAEPWISIYTFDTMAVPGQIISTGSLSITNKLLNNAQDFSASVQVRIGQRDTSVIAANEYGNGLTIDDFRMYSVKNDVQLLSILSPQAVGCDMTTAPVSLLVYNSDNLPQHQVSVSYQLDNGVVVTEMIDSIAAKDTIVFTFPQPLQNINYGSHDLDVWLVANGDTYLPNDSIRNYHFRSQPLIDQFPYLQDFEAGDGFWFAAGRNSSWEYGHPDGPVIQNAASGENAWTTSLAGNYNDNEYSYLYSPCFDIGSLNNPMLSFSLITDIEDCGDPICDNAFVEYSVDGTAWTRLGAQGEGYNWYQTAEGWEGTDRRWRVASIPLPQGLSGVRLRFVLLSDAGAVKDGIAIDDIHLFDLEQPIGNNDAVKEQSIFSNTWEAFVADGKILAAINSFGQNLGATKVQRYKHQTALNPASLSYDLPVSFVIQAAADPDDSVGLRLFVTDEAVISMLQDPSCGSCDKAPDAYRLGITQYDDPEPASENGFLSDNRNGVYRYIPYTQIRWVPYDKGYYAQTSVRSFSEFWFNTGVPEVSVAAGTLYPNPVTNRQLFLFWNAVPGTSFRLALFDITGRKVYETNAVATDYDNRTKIELPPLPTGVYFVRYAVGDAIKTVKILNLDLED